MERAFYLVTGIVLAGFFGFFALWTHADYDGLFWFCVAGAIVGGLLILVAVISTAVSLGIRESRSEEPRSRVR